MSFLNILYYTTLPRPINFESSSKCHQILPFASFTTYFFGLEICRSFPFVFDVLLINSVCSNASIININVCFIFVDFQRIWIYDRTLQSVFVWKSGFSCLNSMIFPILQLPFSVEYLIWTISPNPSHLEI